MIQFICGILILAMFITHPVMLLPFAIVIVLLLFEPELAAKIQHRLETVNQSTLKVECDLPDEECFCDPGRYYKEQLKTMFKPDAESNPELQKLRAKVIAEIDKNRKIEDAKIAADTARYIDRYC